MIDWIEQDKARLRDIEIYLAEAEFLGLSDEEVATLENEANEIEGALSEETAVASTAGRLFLGPDSFFDGRIFEPSAH